MNKIALLGEIFIIFILFPLLSVSGILPKEAMMPVLWIMSLYAYLTLRKKKIRVFAFDFEKKELAFVLKRFFLIGSAITLFILIYEPEILFSLVKNDPWRWLLIILFYPFASAAVQELLFRNFFFYRYKKLFSSNLLIFVLVNALLFSYVHIIFENWPALIFTFFGGLLFAHTYLKTKSTSLTAIEHALYGNALYTLGLGHYFYHSANL